MLLNLLLLHIAVNGPKLRADVARMAKAEDASPVVCGHSHVPFAAHDKGVTVFFIQAENDFDTSPSRVLSDEMKQRGKPIRYLMSPS